MKKVFTTIVISILYIFAQAQQPYPTAPPAAGNIAAIEYFIDANPNFGSGTSLTGFTAAQNINSFAGTINLAGLPSGFHRIYFRTRDVNGNWSLSSNTFFDNYTAPVYAAAPPPATNINGIEYSIDGITAFGAGTPITGFTTSTDINVLGTSIDLTGITPGYHRIYMRSKNTNEKWSLTNFSVFDNSASTAYPPAPAPVTNMVQLEYFIDNNDLGFGNCTPIPFTAGTNIANLNANINVTGLSTGVHRLYIRGKDENGKWSITNINVFDNSANSPYPLAPPPVANMVQLEYFIDNNDLGFGNCTPIPITAGTNIANLNTNINITGLAAGVHRLYIRGKDANGKWSITNFSVFDNTSATVYPTAPPAPPVITKMEFFIDTDPGFGNGQDIPVTPATNLSNINVSANTSGLAPGVHHLFVRSKDANNKWSLTNESTFNKGTLTVLPDSLVFFNTILNTSATKVIAVKNNSNAVQSITGVTVASPFSSDFTATRNINAGQTDTLHINFAPTVANNYSDTVVLQTSAGLYKIPVKGTGVASISSWVLEPATGHDYGNIQTGTSANFNFTIRNTGNTPITLNQVSTSNVAFTPTYTSGTVIASGATLNLPVAFNPSSVGTYSTVLKIKAASGADSVTTIINGIGFTPATAPTLSFISSSPYSGVSGVNPAAGQTGIYTYKILYRSADNRPPAAGYPQVGLDNTGDQDFDDLGEGLFTMVPESNSTDYVTGVVYTYTINYSNYSSTLGYRFFAKDALGNTAVVNNVAYNNGPIVTFQTLDLKLFANNISFSKANPLPGETFTVTATITNSSAFNAVNVPVYFYQDTILIGSTTIPSVNAFSTATVTRTLSFGVDGFYPIKVWIDPIKTLNESNVLNNYAIRPVIVGTPILPGGITVTADTSVQNCPSQKVVFTGHADYYGTSIPTVVSGAEVTLTVGSLVLNGTTDVNGNFTIIMENPPCGNSLIYTVSVTDFTFTSGLFIGAVIVPCSGVNACIGNPPPSGGATINVSSSPCSAVTGTTSTGSVTIKYRGRNIANMWSLWDKIWKDTVKVFSDGVLIQTLYTDDIPLFGSAGTFPGDEKIIPVNIPVGTPGPHVITVVATYVYNEFFQNEDNFYHGVFTPMTATASTTLFATPNKPDLTLDNFKQPNFRTLTFDDKNIECVAAGLHIVRVVDVTTPGTNVLLQSNTISSVGPKSSVPISVSLASLSFGTHILRVITDTTELIDESNESNNIFLVTLNIPMPDLTVSKVIINPTNLSVGATVKFTATIKNSGTAAGPFTVRFLANGVPIGADVSILSIDESGEDTIISNGFNVPNADKDCPINITVIADAGNAINESNETNNSLTFQLGSDINPAQFPVDFGSAGNPVKVRVNTAKLFNVHVRNTGTRDISNVTVKFMHNGIKIGEALIPNIVAGKDFPAVASFTNTFTTPGLTTVYVITDTANTICEIDETNNVGAYIVNVTDSKEDYEVLSQYISPSSLNPNAGQNITIVGTVKNIGNKIAPANILRFYVDNIKLGNDVPFNSLQIGQDTTIAATVTYSSPVPGVKVVKIVVDGDSTVTEEDENNNLATRIIIVGDAPDMTHNIAQPIAFNPNGFMAGDSVDVSFQVKNAGSNSGTAWTRFKIFDAAGTLTALDSVQFTLAAGANTTLTKKMFFAIDSGYVVTEIVNCSPLESNLLNNTDTLHFSHVAKMKANVTVSNLDMKAGAPLQLPGWIGGKIELGNFDLTVNGNIINVDTAHFIITNGTGKLRIVNSNAVNIFPVGTSLYSSNFVKINNTGTADNFTVRVVPYVLQNGNTGDTIRTGNVNRTWLIDEDVPGGSNASVEMFWFAPHELPAFDRSISKAAHYVSSWQLGTTGDALTDTIAGRYSKLQTGYTSFSPFTVTSSNTIGLPLKFLSFTAQPNGNDVQLNWVTENEINTSHFDIENSKDGLVFEKIGNVAAANTGGRQLYNFKHLSPQGNILYYRIKQVDIDGRFEYSNIVKVEIQRKLQPILYPNPATNLVQVKNINAVDVILILVYTADGKQIMNLLPNAQMQFNIGSLNQGMYILEIVQKNQIITKIPFLKM